MIHSLHDLIGRRVIVHDRTNTIEGEIKTFFDSTQFLLVDKDNTQYIFNLSRVSIIIKQAI